MSSNGPQPILDLESASSWKYRGEGAANVVVAYEGANQDLGGQVLRIPKDIRQSTGPLLDPLEQEVWAKFPAITSAHAATELAYQYYKDVMGPLLGRDLVDPGVPVPTDDEFLTQLAASVEGSRPARWQKEGPLKLMSGWALLIQDHASPPRRHSSDGQRPFCGTGPAVCVEIKPKAGFLPTSNCISSSNQVKLQKSRYELMQHLKAQQKKVDSISSYNPLDFFSPNPNLVKRAIDALFDNPQNNLRIFVDGKLVTWTGEDRDLAGVESALAGFCGSSKGSAVTVLKELLVQRLAGSTILQSLRETQMLDRYDIEGIIHLYRALSGQSTDQATSSGALPVATKRLLGLSRESQIQVLRDFLIATTAKDCGLMLTFQAVKSERLESAEASDTTILKLQERSYVCKVAYVDLDLKPLRKIPIYWELDQQVIAAYKSRTEGL